MTLPDREDAQHWVDRNVVDKDGADLGTVTRVYADLDSGAPEWLLIARSEERTAIVPLMDAADHDGHIRVTVALAQVDDAPQPAEQERLSTDEEAALYQHYGVEFASTTSESVLPASVTGADTPPADAADGDASEADSAPAEADAAPTEPPPPPPPPPAAPPLPPSPTTPHPAPPPPPPPPRVAAAPSPPPASSRKAPKPLPILAAAAAILALLIGRRRRRKRRSASAARSVIKPGRGRRRGRRRGHRAARKGAARAVLVAPVVHSGRKKTSKRHRCRRQSR
jgi:outer membrane biosynthesis protein TonB